jgi:hypothetical protein
MPQMQGVKGEAVVIYREPLTTQQMRYHRLSRRVNNTGGFSHFIDVTGGEFYKIAQKDRKARLLLLFRTFCHVVYATLGITPPLMVLKVTRPKTEEAKMKETEIKVK